MNVEGCIRFPPFDYDHTVATTWLLAMEHIDQETPAATELLRLCAYLGADDIPLELVLHGGKHFPSLLAHAVAEPGVLNTTIKALRDYSLIERHNAQGAEKGALSLHRLSQIVVRYRLQESERRQWLAIAMQLVYDALVEAQHDATRWPMARRLHHHADTVMQHLKASWTEQSPERMQREMALALATAQVAVAVEGYATPGVNDLYHQALVRCQRLRDNPALSHALFGLLAFYSQRGDLVTAEQLGKQFVELAQGVGDRGIQANAHVAWAWVRFCQGFLEDAQDHFERAIALYDADQDHVPASFVGFGPGVWCRAFLAHTLWTRGRPKQAIQTLHAALALAEKRGDPLTQAAVLCWASLFHIIREDAQKAYDYAQRALAIASERKFNLWEADAQVYQGWAAVQLGGGAQDIQTMQHGLATLQRLGIVQTRPRMLTFLAQAYARCGQLEDALRTMDEALELSDSAGERLWKAECYRHKGQILLSTSEAAQAEECFRQAWKIAWQPGARAFAWRALVGLGEIRRKQGKHKEAQEVLFSVWHEAQDGLDMTDRLKVQRLLGEYRNLKHIQKHLEAFHNLDPSLTLADVFALGQRITSRSENLLEIAGGREVFEEIVIISGQHVRVQVVLNPSGVLRSMHIRP